MNTCMPVVTHMFTNITAINSLYVQHGFLHILNWRVQVVDNLRAGSQVLSSCVYLCASVYNVYWLSEYAYRKASMFIAVSWKALVYRMHSGYGSPHVI